MQSVLYYNLFSLITAVQAHVNIYGNHLRCQDNALEMIIGYHCPLTDCCWGIRMRDILNEREFFALIPNFWNYFEQPEKRLQIFELPIEKYLKLKAFI